MLLLKDSNHILFVVAEGEEQTLRPDIANEFIVAYTVTCHRKCFELNLVFSMVFLTTPVYLVRYELFCLVVSAHFAKEVIN